MTGGTVILGVASNGGDSPEYYGGSLTAGDVSTIFSVPQGATYKEKIEGGYVAVGAASTSLNVFVGTAPPGQRALCDFSTGGAMTVFFGPTIGAPAGSSLASGVKFVTFYDDVFLYPGEQLSALVIGDNGSYSFKTLREPI